MSEHSLSAQWQSQAPAWEAFARTPGHDRHFHGYNWPCFRELMPPPGRATLDLGCGEGRLGVLLAEMAHRLTGIDLAPSMATLSAETGAYRDVVVGDAAALPFGGGAFDLVVAFMSLQDMGDAAAAVRESSRVLAPGGHLLVAIVHPFASAHLSREASEQRAYFEVQRTLDEVERNGIKLAFHQVHRPLQEWLALFFAAGFLVEELREPRPSEEAVRADPSLTKARDRPAFLHVRCVKGASR